MTNLPSAETFVDVWRSVPTVNDVALTGPDAGIRGHAARTHPAATSWTDVGRRFRSRRSGRSPITRRRERTAASADRRPGVVSAGPVHESPRACSRGCDRVRAPSRCRIPIRQLNELEQEGKAVFGRACAQCHGGPGQSTPATPGLPARSFAFTASRAQCPRPVDTVSPARLVLCGVPAATRAKCADLRDHVGESDQDPPDELRSRVGPC